MHASCGVLYGRCVDTPLNKATGYPPQDDRDLLFLINSLLALVREIQGFYIGGVHWQIWLHWHLEGNKGHFGFPTSLSTWPVQLDVAITPMLLAWAMSLLKEVLTSRWIPISLEWTYIFPKLCNLCIVKKVCQIMSSSCTSTSHQLS
jgi:hypothetical protein